MSLRIIAFMLLHLAACSLPSSEYPHGDDLFSFVTRPDIRSPRFNVTIYKPELVTPGYWFTAPYVDLKERLPTTLFSPSQTGPHIYDRHGELVWCGTHLFGSRPTFDFKAVSHNGSEYLTFLVGEDLQESRSPGGSGHFLDASYNYHQRPVYQINGRGTMNMHEFKTIDDGKRALLVTYESKLFDVNEGNSIYELQVFVGNNGFVEIDLVTGQTLFSWWALDHVQISESDAIRPGSIGTYDSPWDFFHMNSVDKTTNGDYLISSRFTSTIYKISGKDGSIIWRLGGLKSDFKLEGFTISSQHDARWSSEDQTSASLTFFNNHADGMHSTANTSSAVEVVLDMSTMTAKLVHEWKRPDGQLTQLRGNAQRLHNGHMFVGWSENTYISEFTEDGDLVMEAQMASHRFNTYRTYKFNFTATPSEPIAVKAFVYGFHEETSITTVYVSWNGATEVAEWKFWSSLPNELRYIGRATKTGFETMFMASGVFNKVRTMAFDIHGNSLGSSVDINVELPPTWPTVQSDAQGGKEHKSGPLQVIDNLGKGHNDFKDPGLQPPSDITNDMDDQRWPGLVGFECRVPRLFRSDSLTSMFGMFVVISAIVLFVVCKRLQRMNRVRGYTLLSESIHI